MSLFLVQHGKSLPKDIDPDRSLSDEGIKEVELIANVAKGYNIRVSLIKHSGKKRAQQTAEILHQNLNPINGIYPSSGLNPLDDVTKIADKIESDENIMLVGHLPFMERLTSYLVSKNMDLTVFKFQNSGIVCLDKNPDNDLWYIKWTLMPNIE